jgi:adenylate cyclase
VGRLPPRPGAPPVAWLLQLLPIAAAAVLLWVVRQSGLTERLNLFAYDQALQRRPAPYGAATPVRIIGIDEQDLARHGPQVPDGLLAEAVERLDRLGVRAIGLDMFCAQPVGFGWQRLRRLAASNPRLISVYFDLDGRRAIPGTPSQRQANADLYTDPQDGVLRRDVLQVSQGVQARSVSLPMRLLQIASDRKAPPRPLPSPLAAAATLTDGAGGYLPESGVSAPAYRQRMLPFHQPGSFPTWSLRSLLRDPLPAATIRQLRSSIVLIGVVAPSSKDTFSVPFKPWRAGQRHYQMPGVEIHAHRLAALLARESGGGHGIQAASSGVNALLLLAGIVAGGVVGEGVASLRRGFLLAALVLPLGVAATAAALALGVWVDGALPLMAFVLIAAAGWLRRGSNQQLKGVRLEHRNRQAESLFARFLSRHVAEALLAGGNPQAPPQELRAVTVLISDLRGFSLITAAHPPADVVRLLNNYLEVMFEVVERIGGTIDEVLGDAVLVLFGAPQPRRDHAEAAIACAIEMQLAMEQVNRINRQQNLPELAMGIGICTGDLMVGTIGSRRRAKYGVVGPAVNLAARIEALTAGGEIFAAESSVRLVEAKLRLDGQHRLAVKGAGEPLRVFSIGAIAGAYNLALPIDKNVLRPLPEPVRVSYQPIVAKTRQGEPLEALVTHLAEGEGCLLAPRGDLEPHTNLVLSFHGIPGEVYAKVRGATGDGGVAIVFTALPAAVRAWIRSLAAAEPPESPL